MSFKDIIYILLETRDTILTIASFLLEKFFIKLIHFGIGYNFDFGPYNDNGPFLGNKSNKLYI